MLKKFVLIPIVAILLGGSATAADFQGGAIVSLVRMTHLNAEMAYQEEVLHTNLPELHLAWGGEFGVVLSLGNLPIRPSLKAQLLHVSVSGGGETTRVSLTGLCAGGAFARGGWQMGAAIHGFRANLSFPLAGYEGLAGWGWGASGCVGYAFPIFARATFEVSAVLQWLPVSKMTDSFGESYLGRGAPFVDFSGIGVSATLRWKTSLF